MTRTTEETIKARAWTNGSGAYGIDVSPKDRERFFDLAWKTVKLRLPTGIEVVANIDKPSFWGNCPHLIAAPIGRWFLADRIAPWAKGVRPAIWLIPEGRGIFRVARDKPA